MTEKRTGRALVVDDDEEVDDDTDGSASDGSARSALDEARAFRRRGTHDDTGE